MNISNSFVRSLAVSLLGLALVAGSARAHFIWLVPPETPVGPDSPDQRLQIHFGERAAPDNPDLLKLIADVEVWRMSGDQNQSVVKLAPRLDGEQLSVPDGELTDSPAIYVATKDLGIRGKDGETFRLVYHAKAGPPFGSRLWERSAAHEWLALDIIPSRQDGRASFQVRFRDAPSAGAEFKVLGPDGQTLDGGTGSTNDSGNFAFTPTHPGRHSIRVRHIEPAVEDRVETRHYVALTLDIPAEEVPIPHVRLADMPTPVTSFGGAVLGEHLYVYGGNTGPAHTYNRELQNDTLYRLPLAGGEWEAVATGPRLQGLALVPHGGRLYRLGGFEARNAPGAEQDLWSVAAVAAFDPASGQWSDLPPLPEPRSSFDAAVWEDTLYVVGGWAMAGDARSVWHDTAWKLDLATPQLAWQPIAAPPFERRALAVAAHEGKIYAIGGMTSGDETTLETDVYDPATDRWSTGPELLGETGMNGFGASAFATGGRLYVSTIGQQLQRLDPDGERWRIIAATPTARFFHRMLPADDSSLVIVGGTNRSGRMTSVERILLGD